MELKNPFSLETRNLFLDAMHCMSCGHSDRPLELHHIFGRVSSSPWNCIRLCKDCHASVNNTLDERVGFCLITVKHLQIVRCMPSEDDLTFIRTFINPLCQKL